MSKDLRDVIDSAAYLIGFFLVCYSAGRILKPFNQARYSKAFAPLAPLIRDVFRDDGSGNSGFMTGAFGGSNLRTGISPDSRSLMFAGHPNQKRNLFHITMEGGAEKQDLNVSFGNKWVLDNCWRAKLLGWYRA